MQRLSNSQCGFWEKTKQDGLHCCSDAEKKLVGIDDSKKCLKEPRLKILKVSYSYGYLSCGYLSCRSQSAIKISSTPSNLAISTAKTAVGCRESTLPVVINLVYPPLSDFRVCCKSFIDTSQSGVHWCLPWMWFAQWPHCQPREAEGLDNRRQPTRGSHFWRKTRSILWPHADLTLSALSAHSLHPLTKFGHSPCK